MVEYILILFLFCGSLFAGDIPTGEHALGSRRYDDYENPEVCKSCHTRIYQQWKQAMMSQAYTHHWDEIEYFELAVPHGEKVAMFKPVADGCNGCHAPLAFLAGDVPPPRPEENSRANESISCDICHTITGIDGDPVNFNWISEPGRVKYGAKPGLESPHHITEFNDVYTIAEYCGSCHNEQNPFGVYVKSTQIEWEEGPYAEQGVPCFVCHMPKAKGRSAPMAEDGMVAQHIFLGAHNEAKLKSAIEISIHPDEQEIPYDGVVSFQVELFNAKAGHKIPTGSVEDRLLWLDVRAVDAEGKEYHLPVDKKGFDGEEYTIAADELAYSDMAVPLGLKNFKGVQRDGIPVGNRILKLFLSNPLVIITMAVLSERHFRKRGLILPQWSPILPEPPKVSISWSRTATGILFLSLVNHDSTDLEQAVIGTGDAGDSPAVGFPSSYILNGILTHHFKRIKKTITLSNPDN